MPLLLPVLRVAALAAFVMAWSAPAGAIPISYDIQSGQTGKFGYSAIHSASLQWSMMPPQYFPRGDILLELDGTLEGDWDAGTMTLTLATSELSALVKSALLGTPDVDVWTLRITGGALTSVGGEAGGTIDYEIYDAAPGLGGTLQASGSFVVFADPAMPDPANSVGAAQVAAWANNWANDPQAPDFRPDPEDFPGQNADLVALGIDLLGTPIILPEASTLALLATGLSGLFVLSRGPRSR